jgi:hypothetical protein
MKIKIKKSKEKKMKFEIKTKQEGIYHSNQGRNQKQISSLQKKLRRKSYKK